MPLHGRFRTVQTSPPEGQWGRGGSPNGHRFPERCYTCRAVMSRIPPDPQDLEASRERRVAQRRLERLEEYGALLRRAASIQASTGLKPDIAIDRLIQTADGQRAGLQLAAEGRVTQRRRPKSSVPKPEDNCLVFLDECGAHFLTAPDAFPVFCLTAVIVRETS